MGLGSAIRPRLEVTHRFNENSGSLRTANPPHSHRAWSRRGSVAGWALLWRHECHFKVGFLGPVQSLGRTAEIQSLSGHARDPLRMARSKRSEFIARLTPPDTWLAHSRRSRLMVVRLSAPQRGRPVSVPPAVK